MLGLIIEVAKIVEGADTKLQILQKLMIILERMEILEKNKDGSLPSLAIL